MMGLWDATRHLSLLKEYNWEYYTSEKAFDQTVFGVCEKSHVCHRIGRNGSIKLCYQGLTCCEVM